MTEAIVVVSATANAHKLAEMRAIFSDAITLKARPADVDEIIEDADTFVGNARLKAQAIGAATGLPVVADDSGLEVDALDGAPGVQSAYFAGGDHDDAANRSLLLERLEGVDSRAARFRTVIVMLWPDGREIVAEGTCPGVIGHEERGENGFGYDSIFHPEAGDGRTFAEHSAAEKNAMSHRNQACRALLAALD